MMAGFRDLEIQLTTNEGRSLNRNQSPDHANDALHQRESRKMRRIALFLGSFILEGLSIAFDQLSTPKKPIYAFMSMITASLGLLLSIIELCYRVRENEIISQLLREASENFGFFISIWQCVYTVVQYVYLYEKRIDSPIKISVLPLIFLICVAISTLYNNYCSDSSTRRHSYITRESSVDASRTTTLSRVESPVSLTNARAIEETERLEEDYPGELITLYQRTSDSSTRRRRHPYRTRESSDDASWTTTMSRVESSVPLGNARAIEETEPLVEDDPRLGELITLLYQQTIDSSTQRRRRPYITRESSVDALRTITSSRVESSVSLGNARAIEETEPLVEDDPGGLITLPPRTREDPWTPGEDKKLLDYVTSYGAWNWPEVPKFAGLSRSEKSCRLRWMNYLDPNVHLWFLGLLRSSLRLTRMDYLDPNGRRGNHIKEKDEILIRAHETLGNRWSVIAGRLPGITHCDRYIYRLTKCEGRGKRQKTILNIDDEIPRMERRLNKLQEALDGKYGWMTRKDICAALNRMTRRVRDMRGQLVSSKEHLKRFQKALHEDEEDNRFMANYLART
ncbi:hypothetical protein HS088_TW10G00495 [Tripterygium wilfordii]|uniref:Uncharacterized protein n=1 Tax=Tripterygium wilfordii TaxID=458696 RepID=A0A7J7D561_TRIWF|nr:uncharacterized protein LOC120007199 isoform X2 [Tripterygium wilfordii]KAF5741497.1 hypothetical protein HS088_TW10G00495 [Tripterygium wilfordii]